MNEPPQPGNAELSDDQRRPWVDAKAVRRTAPESTPANPKAAPEPLWPPGAVRVRSLLALIAMVGVCDATIYRGEGFAGPSAMFLAAPVILLFARPKSVYRTVALLLFGMLLLLALRLLWCGSMLTVVCGVCVLVAFALSLNGRPPYVLQTLIFGCQTIPQGARVINELGSSARSIVTREPSAQRAGWLSTVVPIVAATAFGLIFVLANPDLLDNIAAGIKPYFEATWEWLTTLDPGEFVFWIFVFWLTAGLVRPWKQSVDDDEDAAPTITAERAHSTLYATCRNTLVTLIALYAVYLVFEFRTLWFREFPKGFYYAGYAHQGAAWLTTALALATFTLSLIFRGNMLNDPRESRLRRLAWAWSALNLVLAASVYNRLAIYIDFNGMTRMRTVGLFGTTTVVAGFLLTLWKIHRDKRFLWLIRRDLWAVAIALIVYSIIPVDWMIHTYNVRQIVAGDLAPVVQITEHPVSDEGLLTLEPLLECDDPVIRRGIAAMLTMHDEGDETIRKSARRKYRGNHWTTWQWSSQILSRQLEANAERRRELFDGDPQDVFQEFRDYAYQWY